MLSSEILFDIHISSLWYQALEMLSSEMISYLRYPYSLSVVTGVRNALE